MDEYVKEANAIGVRVKSYYTVRELSNRAAELFVLRQLGDEILSTPACSDATPPPGGCRGTAWHREHLQASYGAAWICELSNKEFDAAVAEQGLAGRWLNYYIEGLQHSVASSPHINGIYYDGILFDRKTMIRVRKVLERASTAEERPLVDFHTGNSAYNSSSFAASVVIS
jgi:hypothetical protein